MATTDRLRIVEIRNTVPYVVLDLLDGTTYNHVKGSFQTTRPQKTRAVVTGARRYDGDRVAFEKMGNASITATWMVGPLATGADTSMANVERLGQAFEDAAHNGRLIEVRFAGTTKSVFYEPRGTPDWNVVNYDPQQVNANSILQATATIPVAPLAQGAPMDVQDDFRLDTITAGDYIKDGAGTLSVSGTRLVPAVTGTECRYRHARGYPYSDCEVRLDFFVSSISNGGHWGVFMGADQTGIDTMLECRLDLAANQIQLATYNAGVRNVLTSTALTVAVNTLYHLRMRREGDLIFYACKADSTNPDGYTFDDFSGTGWVGTPFKLGTGTIGDFNFQRGDCGIRVQAGNLAEWYDNFAIRPYSYYSAPSPEVIRLNGAIPGTAPALCDFEITTNDAGAIGQAPLWALAAWSERPQVTSLVNYGDFEFPNAFGLDGWSHLAQANFTTANATSHARDATSGKYGLASLQVVCPATSDTGLSYYIGHRFKKNRQYVAYCWTYSAAGTTLVRTKLGSASGVDLVTETSIALAARPWQLHTVAWRPSTDADGAYFAITIGAATATTFNIDGVIVMEVPTITTTATMTSSQTTLSVNAASVTDIPNSKPDGSITQPFLFAVDYEWMRCLSINPTTKVWTIERAVEGTTAATHLQASVMLLPYSQGQLEGRGAQPAFGIVEGESFANDVTSPGTGTTARTTDTTARGQSALQLNGGGATANLYWYVDPNTLVADDFTQGEIDVQVFARMNLVALTTATQSMLTSVEPTERIAANVLAGRARYTREYGTALKTFVQPATVAGWRLAKLGTFPMIVDKQNPQRWRIRMHASNSVSTLTTVDYLLLSVVRSFACLPTGKADDQGATYPNLIPFDAGWGAGDAVTKVFRADGSALIRNPIPAGGRLASLPPAFPDHGLGRSITLPAGDVDAMIKISDTIPDDPTANNATDMSGGASPSLAITERFLVIPRFFVGRGGV